MKKFDLKKLGLQELDKKEQVKTNGGIVPLLIAASWSYAAVGWYIGRKK